MATIVGSILLHLKAKTASFDKGMKRGRKNMSSFSRAIGSAQKMVLGFGAAVGAYVGVQALKSFVSGSMESIDATAKLADRIGSTTEELISLRHAAEIMGASSQVMDKGLENLVRRLGEVRMGTGEAVDGLASLNLEANDLIDKSPAQAFGIIADRLNQIPKSSDKAAAAYKLFGRQGQVLLNTLSLGSEGLEAMAREAEKLGLTFSRFDAAKVEAANDAMLRVKRVITGLGQTLAIELAPFIEAISVKFEKMATDGDLAGGVILSSVEGVAKGIGAVADFVRGLQVTFLGLKLVATGVLTGIAGLVNLLALTIEKVINLIPGVEVSLAETTGQLTAELAKATAGTAKKFAEIADQKPPSETIAKAFEKIRGAAQKAAAAAIDTNKALDSTAAAEAIEKTLAQMKKMEQSAKRVFDQTRSPLENYEKKLGELSTLLEKGLIDWETYGRAVRMANEALQSSSTPGEKAGLGSLSTGSTGSGINSAITFAAAKPLASDNSDKGMQQKIINELKEISRNTKGIGIGPKVGGLT